MGTVRYGMPVGGPLQAVGPLAKAIEDRGFDSVWTTETTANPFIQAALVAQATSRVRIGTGIALGFGPQVKRVNEQRFSTPFEHPAPKMREYALAIRAFWGGYSGEEPRFQGRFYQVTMAPWPHMPPPLRPAVPILFAAGNRRMLQAAGEVADGVIGHPLTSPRYVRELVLPSIVEGAARAGRPPTEVELVQTVLISIS